MDNKKPLNLALYELKQEIVRLMTESKLPGYLLEPIFKELYGDCLNASQKELAEARATYEKAHAKETNAEVER